MLRGKKLFVALAAFALALTVAHAALADDPKGSDHGTVTTGNGIYDASVEDSDDGMGQYTARTGDNHPITIETEAHQDVLYGGASESPGTSWSTIRSYTSQTDYINDDYSGKNSSFNVVVLDPYATVEPIGTTGTRTTYVVTSAAAQLDDLTIVEDVNINGSTLSDSSVEITTSVTNDGDEAVDIGIRYLWDWDIGDDDGPSFTPIDPDGAAVVTEQTYVSPAFTAYAIQDNDEAGAPLFVVYGTVNGPAAVEPPPVAPDTLMFVAWSPADDEAFDYVTSPSLDVASADGDENDSAVLYYWGPNAQDAIHLEPGESVTVSASLFAAEPGEPPPFIGATPTPFRRNPTDTPTPTATAEPTDTPVPADTPTPPPPPPPAPTPTGGGMPEIQAPPTGQGSGTGNSSTPWLGLAAAGVSVAAAGALLRAVKSRR
ncbi:MAG: hypothetical protein QME71_09325 [Dehalococcoidia bacterium]|nr:hypothetical protein [Dehalococcoidia bacterium]